MISEESLDFLERIEEYLLKANIHISIVSEFKNFLIRKIKTCRKISKNDIIECLRNQIKFTIKKYIKDFDINKARKPYTMLVCGINGSGKTTIVGKMASLLQAYDWNILVASCDTFRMAGAQQLKAWIKEPDENFLSNVKSCEAPYKIAIGAYNLAKKKHKDILIIDTSGRLENNQNLMAELFKLKWELKKTSNNIPNDIVLIIDSSCGYNALEQVKMYNELIGLTGIIATKIDISKRPGIILSVCKLYDICIFGVSDGERREQIRDLEPQEFADSILKDINSIRNDSA